MGAENIVLIGFMGSGKSSVGSALAQHLKRFLLDTDALIELTYKKTIREIFESFGEARFREIESELLAHLVGNSSNFIIATGGGFGLQKDIKKLGIVVFLDISFHSLLARFDALSPAQKQIEIAKRPLFNDLDSLKKLYDTRILTYRTNADVTIPITHESYPEQIIEQITTALNF